MPATFASLAVDLQKTFDQATAAKDALSKAHAAVAAAESTYADAANRVRNLSEQFQSMLTEFAPPTGRKLSS